MGSSPVVLAGSLTAAHELLDALSLMRPPPVRNLVPSGTLDVERVPSGTLVGTAVGYSESRL